MQFIAVLGNAVGIGFNTLASCLPFLFAIRYLVHFPFLFPIRYLVTKSDLRCFVAVAGMLPTIGYVRTCRSNNTLG